MLLIDEIDRADEPFEAYLLEILSDFAVTVPEIGTIKADVPPHVVLTSNRTREVHDALKRRCLYHWIDYPSAERETEIVLAHLPDAPRCSSPRSSPSSRSLRDEDLTKLPGVAETLDWAAALMALGAPDLDRTRSTRPGCGAQVRGGRPPRAWRARGGARRRRARRGLAAGPGGMLRPMAMLRVALVLGIAVFVSACGVLGGPTIFKDADGLRTFPLPDTHGACSQIAAIDPVRGTLHGARGAADQAYLVTTDGDHAVDHLAAGLHSRFRSGRSHWLTITEQWWRRKVTK